MSDGYICNKAVAGDIFKNANWVELTNNSNGKKTVFGTSACMVYDDEFIYTAFECTDDNFNATLTEYNDLLYNEDVVEVFIDDDSDKKTYIEIELNPLNAVLHYYIRNDLKDSFWGYARINQNVTSSVEIKPNGNNVNWRAELKIPLSEFVAARNIPPNRGDTWYFNFYRIKTSTDGKPEYSSYSNTGADNFHCPESFSKLIFN